MNLDIYKRIVHKREDGSLVELFSKKYDDFKCVHSYFVSINPGCIRAKHYHKNKVEYLVSIHGKIEVILEDVSTKKSKSILLDSENDVYSILKVPPNIAHAIKNPGSSTSKLVVFSNSYDLKDAYPYSFKVFL